MIVTFITYAVSGCRLGGGGVLAKPKLVQKARTEIKKKKNAKLLGNDNTTEKRSCISQYTQI